MHKKNKYLKLSLILLIIALLLSTFSGCGKKEPDLTAKETLDKIFQQSATLQDYTVEFEGKMNMTMEGDIDPEAAAMIQMFQNIEYNGSLQMAKQQVLSHMGMNFNINMSGMSMAIEAYFDGEQIIVKYPLLPQYIVLNLSSAMDELTAYENLNETFTYENIIKDMDTLIVQWMPGYYSKMVDAIDETALELIDSHEFLIGGESIKSRAIKMTMTPDMMVDVIDVMMEQAIADETLYNILKKYDQYDDLGTFEEFKAEIQEGRSEMLAALDLDELQNSMNDMDYTYIMGYDKDFKPILMDMKISMVVEEDMLNIKSRVDTSGVLKYNYSKPTINFPEITPENSMDLMEQLGMLLFGMGDFDYSWDDDYYDFEDDNYSAFYYNYVYILEDFVWYLEDDYDFETVAEKIEEFIDYIYFDTAYVYFASNDGDMLIWPQTELPPGYDPRDFPFYQDALVMDYVSSDIYDDPTTMRKVQSFSQKVVVNGEVVGVLGIDFYVD